MYNVGLTANIYSRTPGLSLISESVLMHLQFYLRSLVARIRNERVTSNSSQTDACTPSTPSCQSIIIPVFRWFARDRRRSSIIHARLVSPGTSSALLMRSVAAAADQSRWAVIEISRYYQTRCLRDTRWMRCKSHAVRGSFGKCGSRPNLAPNVGTKNDMAYHAYDASIIRMYCMICMYCRKCRYCFRLPICLWHTMIVWYIRYVTYTECTETKPEDFLA